MVVLMWPGDLMLMQDWVFRLGVKTKYTSRKGERDLMSNRRLCWVGRVKYDEVGYLVDQYLGRSKQLPKIICNKSDY